MIERCREMQWPFCKKQKDKPEEQTKSIWKEDFSDCETLEYLPDYSVCKCTDRCYCRHVAMYAGMVLCSNPRHKSFILPGSEPFDPHKNLF